MKFASKALISGFFFSLTFLTFAQGIDNPCSCPEPGALADMIRNLDRNEKLIFDKCIGTLLINDVDSCRAIERSKFSFAAVEIHMGTVQCRYGFACIVQTTGRMDYGPVEMSALLDNWFGTGRDARCVGPKASRETCLFARGVK
ncbi:MAG: hypothetical protein H0U73_04250 [Tatlockia sp.]|nr:hypothetical protein [Tatlockia sp.]